MTTRNLWLNLINPVPIVNFKYLVGGIVVFHTSQSLDIFERSKRTSLAIYSLFERFRNSLMSLTEGWPKVQWIVVNYFAVYS